MCQIDLPEEERRRLLEEREEDLFATILVPTTAPTKADKSYLDSSLMTSVPRQPLTMYLKIYWALISPSNEPASSRNHACSALHPFAKKRTTATETKKHRRIVKIRLLFLL